MTARTASAVAVNLALRAAIVFWLAEAWVMQEDPRFAGKAIPERNTLIVGALALAPPAYWLRRGLAWRRYPFGFDALYLSIFALDMAGNSFDLYRQYGFFDLIPHFHGPGVTRCWWARSGRRRAIPSVPRSLVAP